METNNDASAAIAAACAETFAYLHQKARFETASRDGFAEAERIVAEYLNNLEARTNGS